MPPGRWTNTSFEPSGDQRGSIASPCGIDTTRVWFEPSSFIVKSSVRPFLQLMNAIDEPSGDHDGYMPLAGSVVRRRSPLPSALATCTSRWTWNVRRAASGDHIGNQLVPVVVIRCGGADVPPSARGA